MKPLSINLFPFSFEGEGDKGGEVGKHSQIGSIYPGFTIVVLLKVLVESIKHGVNPESSVASFAFSA